MRQAGVVVAVYGMGGGWGRARCVLFFDNATYRCRRYYWNNSCWFWLDIFGFWLVLLLLFFLLFVKVILDLDFSLPVQVTIKIVILLLFCFKIVLILYQILFCHGAARHLLWWDCRWIRLS